MKQQQQQQQQSQQQSPLNNQNGAVKSSKKAPKVNAPDKAADQKPKKNSSLVPLIVIGVLVLAILGACIWFFVFYTDKAKGSGRGHHDYDDENTEMVDRNGGSKKVDRNLLTPDLAYNDLKGPVEFVRQGSDYGYGTYFDTEYFYSPEGEWINIPRWKEGEASHFSSQSDKYWKDANGYIIAISDWSGDSGYTTRTSINWEDGKVVSRDESSETNSYDYYSSSNTTTDYIYDDKGLLNKAERNYSYSSYYGGGNYSDTYVYSYLEFDDYGNWTKRNVSDRYSNNEGYTNTNSYVEVREIKYYE